MLIAAMMSIKEGFLLWFRKYEKVTLKLRSGVLAARIIFF